MNVNMLIISEQWIVKERKDTWIECLHSVVSNIAQPYTIWKGTEGTTMEKEITFDTSLKLPAANCRELRSSR